MLLLYILIVTFVIVVFLGLYIVYNAYGNKQLKKAIFDDTLIFYKKQPDSYKIVAGKKSSLSNYPFLKESEWSVPEQNALFKDEPQILVHEHEDKLYSIDIRRMKLFGSYALMVKMTKFNETLTSKSQDRLLNHMDCDFLAMDGDYNIVYRNKAASSYLNFPNIYDVCLNKPVLKAVTESQVSTKQVILLKVGNVKRYYEISFYPKVKYGTDQYYWFLLCNDITELVLLKKQISSKVKILDILQNGIYELFTDNLLEKSIVNILYDIGTNLDVQRAYIYRFYNDTFFLEYEWRDTSIEAENELYSTIEKGVYLKFIKTKSLEPIIILKEDVSPERQKVWDTHGITCKIITPLFTKDGKIWGLLGFDCYNYRKDKWNAEQLGLIKLIAVTLNAVIVLDEDDKQIKSLNKQIKEILKTLSIRINSEIEQAQFINETLRLENNALSRTLPCQS